MEHPLPNRRTSQKPQARRARIPATVKLPLRLQSRGTDASIVDARGTIVVARTEGFPSGRAHEQWLRWIIATANAPAPTT